MTDRELRVAAWALLGFIGSMLALQGFSGGLRTYEGNGFEIDLPNGWDETAPPFGDQGVRVVAPAGVEETPRPSVVVTFFVREAAPSLDGYFEETERLLRDRYRDYRLRSHWDSEIDGFPAKRTTFTYRSGEERVIVRGLAYYVVGRGRVWSVTCTSNDQTFDEKLKWFESIATSLELD